MQSLAKLTFAVNANKFVYVYCDICLQKTQNMKIRKSSRIAVFMITLIGLLHWDSSGNLNNLITIQQTTGSEVTR